MADDLAKEIVISGDSTDAVEALKDLGKASDKLDEKLKQAAESSVKASDKARKAHERTVASFERRVQFAGMNEQQRLLADAARITKGLEDRPERKAQVQAVVNVRLEQIKAAEAEKAAADAAKETKRVQEEAAKAAEKRSNAIKALNKSLVEEVMRDEAAAKAARATAAALVERAQYRTSTAVGRLQMDRQTALREAAPGAVPAQLQEINRHYDKLIENQEKSDRLAARNKLAENLRNSAEAADFFATRFLAAMAVVGGTAVYLTKIAVSLERTQFAFGQLLGSKAAGDAFFQSLIDYSKQSVFALDDITKAAQGALARGFKPEQALQVVKVSFAAAAAMGREAESAERLILALSQIQAKQKVSAEEMNQLAELGIQGWKALADFAGKPVQEIMDKSEKGMINANVAVRVLIQSMQRLIAVEEQLKTGTVSGQIAGLKNEIVDTARELDKTLLPAARTAIGLLRDLGGAAKDAMVTFQDMPGWVQTAAVAFLGLATATAGVALGFSSVAKAAAFLLGPLGIGAGAAIVWGIAAALAGLVIQFQAMRYAARDFNTEWERLRNKGRSPTMEKKYLDILRERNKKTTEGLTAEIKGISYESLFQEAKESEEKKKRAAEAAARKRAEQIEAAQQALERAQAAEIAGIGAIALEYQKLFRRVAGNREAELLAQKAFGQALLNEKKKLQDQAKQDAAEQGKLIEEEDKNMRRFWSEQYRDRLKAQEDYEKQTVDMMRETMKRRYEMAIEGVEAERALRKSQLEARRATAEAGMLGADPRQVLAMKIQFEREAAAIEIEAAEKIHARKMELIAIEWETRRNLLEAEFLSLKEKTPEAYEAFAARYNIITKQMEMARTTQAADTEGKIARERLEVTKRVNDLIIEEHKRQYDKIYDAASGILDNLLSKSRSWGDVMKSIIKAAILTPIKEAAAHWIAGVLTPRPVVTGPGGTQTGPQQQGLKGLWDSISRVIGITPVSIRTPPILPPSTARSAAEKATEKAADISASGAKTASAAATTSSSAADTAAAAAVTSASAAKIVADRCACTGSGGTSKAMQLAQIAGTLISARQGGGGGGGGGEFFVPPGPGMERYPTGTIPGGGGGGGGGGIPGRLGQLKDIIGLGNPQGVWQGGGTLGKVATSDASALAGAALLYYGLKRGGWGGVAMSTAGGALVGAKIGTLIAPGIGTAIGAAVGAIAGFTAGMIRRMFKSAEQKAVEKVKSVYAVTIDKGMGAQIAGIAKERYGGNLNVAVYSPEVRELVELYALSTGQSPSGMPRQMYPVSGYTQGGADYISPTYASGHAVPNPYVGPTTGPMTIPGAGVFSGSTYIQLNPEQAQALLQGRVVQIIQGNSGVVATANTDATKAGTSRQAARAAYSEPLTTLA